MGMKERLPINEISAEQVKRFDEAHQRFMRMATMSQEEANDLFNAGRFNDIAIGYAKLALRTMGEKAEKVAHFEKVMKAMLDTFDAEAARTAYFKD